MRPGIRTNRWYGRASAWPGRGAGPEIGADLKIGQRAVPVGFGIGTAIGQAEEGAAAPRGQAARPVPAALGQQGERQAAEQAFEAHRPASREPLETCRQRQAAQRLGQPRRRVAGNRVPTRTRPR